jgi:hypothetical protein
MKKTDIIIAKALLAWYGRHRRILPWRKPEKDAAQDPEGSWTFYAAVDFTFMRKSSMNSPGGKRHGDSFTLPVPLQHSAC